MEQLERFEKRLDREILNLENRADRLQQSNKGKNFAKEDIPLRLAAAYQETADELRDTLAKHIGRIVWAINFSLEQPDIKQQVQDQVRGLGLTSLLPEDKVIER